MACRSSVGAKDILSAFNLLGLTIRPKMLVKLPNIESSLGAEMCG